mmetsp:Transcript_10631/g.22502  ORF Transcript_10631/g.22502 Transcript_10631/m.22502 type:complete len:293 (+) Transcript_10631:142-1020(+)
MGKKSKNKAKAKARPVGGEKLPTCTRCFTLVRTNRAATCPGCTRIFCGRCESKWFRGCSLGSECVLPMRRCVNCISGSLIWDELGVTAEGVNEDDEAEFISARFEELMVEKPLEARPDMYCLKDGCFNSLCRPCVEHGEALALRTDLPPPFSFCSACRKTRCATCVLDAMQAEGMVEDFIGKCAKCCQEYCFECVEPSYWHAVPGVASHGNAVLCSPCYPSYQYWLEKPCTNPDCPNTAGMVETRRCGDCRTARYCSKECQRAMRSTHKQECIEMKKKRERRAAAARLVAAK